MSAVKAKDKTRAGAKAASKKSPKPKRPRITGPEVLVIQGGQLVTVDDEHRVLKADLRIEDGKIVAMAESLPTTGATRVLDARGLIVLPGFAQCHIHLCQTLFRSQADDMELLAWLREKIWPLEGALEAEDMRAAARLGLAELLLGGTTSILDMGSVRHHDEVFTAARESGIRYTGGKCLMDQGQGFPPGLRESTDWAMSESIRLCEAWHGQDNGRLRYAFTPRFVLSCSEEALRRSVQEARARGALLHTHSSENSEEVELVRERTGMGNVEYLHSVGFTGPDVFLAHGIWLSTAERRLLRETKTRLVHCPSSNLKLASGIARVSELLDEQIHITLGADGAACANALDGFMEMRLAALLHKVKGGPTAVPAARALRLATRDGARALGHADVGTIEVGQRADLQLLDLHRPHVFPELGDLTSRIVYAARASDVHTVLVDGRIRVEEGKLTWADVDEVLSEAQAAAVRVTARVS